MTEQQVPLDARPVVPVAEPGEGEPEGAQTGRRIGVYVCQCGGNISDYVDVEKVIEGIRDDGDVVVSRTAMFACSDATQQDIAADIETNALDGLVVASCSPKLHTYTFRGVAARLGCFRPLNHRLTRAPSSVVLLVVLSPGLFPSHSDAKTD